MAVRWALAAALLAGCATQTPVAEPLAELPMIGSSVVLPEVAAGTLVLTTHCTGDPSQQGEVRVTRDITVGVPCSPIDAESTSWIVFKTDRDNVRVSLRGGEGVTLMRASVTWEDTTPAPGEPTDGADLVVRVD